MKNKIPTKLKIGPYKYKVKVVKNINKFVGNKKNNISVYGYVDPKVQIIYLMKGQAYETMVDSLWHEINHVIWASVGGWASGVEEEKAVSMLSTIQILALKENKNLTKYLGL